MMHKTLKRRLLFPSKNQPYLHNTFALALNTCVIRLPVD